MDSEGGDLNGTAQDKSQILQLGKIPGLGRTISAICEDELYNLEEPIIPAQISQPTTPRPKADGVNSSPVNSVFSQRLQAANQSHLDAQRSASPAQSISREKSPFRPNFRPDGVVYEPSSTARPQMHSAAQIREYQRAEDAAHALQAATRRASRESSVTVSPKEVSLEYEPPETENQAPLFSSLPSPTRHGRTSRQPSKLQQELTRSSTYENILQREESSNVSNDSATSNGSQPLQVPQQYPFIRTRPSGGVPESSQESNPQFPARLISMESTRSDQSIKSPETNGRPASVHSEQQIAEDQEEDEDQEEEDDDNDSDTPQQEVTRPTNTQAEGGTYTCTYHGCTQRFETPQKLQKHKKEGHRQGTPSNIDNRLTQAGPHKCTRINPSTGKPCNSIFSRPYDLTRHEDTIHNGKKQKVRCMICTEEKTFSRNDALTRHMRVVHTDVDFPGKQAKRGSK